MTFQLERKRMRTAKHTDLEAALFLWFKQARNMNIPISGPLLQEKATMLSQELGISNFKANPGCL